jgi:hypothetical protein
VAPVPRMVRKTNPSINSGTARIRLKKNLDDCRIRIDEFVLFATTKLIGKDMRIEIIVPKNAIDSVVILERKDDFKIFALGGNHPRIKSIAFEMSDIFPRFKRK